MAKSLLFTTPRKTTMKRYFRFVPGRTLHRLPDVANLATQIRLYYIQKGTADDDPGQDRQIRELCYTQKVSHLKDKKKSAWYRGSNGKPTFDAKNIIADVNSPLSATYDGKILRVFYKKPTEDKLYVAYTKDKPAPSAQEVWDERVAADKF
jgi:hypothetical protein